MSAESYDTPGSRMKAVQFQDPFAECSFVVGNTATRNFCLTHCDSLKDVSDEKEVEILDDASAALNAGYKPCSRCLPLQSNSMKVTLAKECMDKINKEINFVPVANILDKIANNEGSSSNNNQLVTIIACRHLCYAAACSYYNDWESESSDEGHNAGGKKKRKRGGLVGFKELATKSKLSPWHFHRVFKSITGLTPKAYGDKCTAFMRDYEARESREPVPMLSPATSSISGFGGQHQHHERAYSMAQMPVSVPVAAPMPTHASVDSPIETLEEILKLTHRDSVVSSDSILGNLEAISPASTLDPEPQLLDLELLDCLENNDVYTGNMNMFEGEMLGFEEDQKDFYGLDNNAFNNWVLGNVFTM